MTATPLFQRLSAALRRSEGFVVRPSAGRRSWTPASFRSGASEARKRHASSSAERGADGVALLEAPADRLAEGGDAAETREEGLLRVDEAPAEAPEARGGLGPDLLGVELQARVVRRLEVVAEPPGRRLLGGRVGREEPDAEPQVSLGEGLEERDGPGAEALGDLGGNGLGDGLVLAAVAAGGEEGEGEPLGAGAGAAAGVGEALEEELARGGVGHVVDDAAEEEATRTG